MKVRNNMILTIHTIGQRDVQLYTNTKEGKYSSFDKKRFLAVQNELRKTVACNRIKWKEATGNEGKENLTEQNISENPTVCFPLLEKTLNYMKNNKTQQVLYLLTTDRQKYPMNRYIEQEPYYFSEIIKYFWTELCTYYDLTANLRIINICDDMEAPYDINSYTFTFPTIDKIVSDINNQYPSISSVNVFNDGGIPIISQILDLSLNAYFPDKTNFLETKERDVVPSDYHKFQKRYSLKFALLQNLKNYNFSEAQKIALSMKINVSNKYLYQLILIAKLWLYDENNETIKQIDDILKLSINQPKLSKLLLKMKIMLKKNVVGCYLIRAMQEERSKNYWGMSTVFISTIELFVKDYFQYYFKDSIVENNDRIFIDISKLDFKMRINDLSYESSKFSSNSDLYILNWKVIAEIINQGTDKKHNHKYDILKNLIDRISGLRQNRNYFIHQGESIPKKAINKALEFDNGLKQQDLHLNSKTIKTIIDEIQIIHKDTYVNWPIDYCNILIEEVTNYSPI